MTILSRQLYRLGERLRGWNILERLRQLQSMERWAADRLAAWQLEHLTALLHHAYAVVDLTSSSFVDASNAVPLTLVK